MTFKAMQGGCTKTIVHIAVRPIMLPPIEEALEVGSKAFALEHPPTDRPIPNEVRFTVEKPRLLAEAAPPIVGDLSGSLARKRPWEFNQIDIRAFDQSGHV